MGAAFGPALWGHLVIFTLVASVAWTLRSHAWLEEPASEMGVVWCGESLGSTSCPTMTDNQAVLRVTLAGVVYFLAHAVLTVNVATEEDPRAKLHGGGCAAWTIRVRRSIASMPSIGRCLSWVGTGWTSCRWLVLGPPQQLCEQPLCDVSTADWSTRRWCTSAGDIAQSAHVSHVSSPGDSHRVLL